MGGHLPTVSINSIHWPRCHCNQDSPQSAHRASSCLCLNAIAHRANALALDLHSNCAPIPLGAPVRPTRRHLDLIWQMAAMLTPCAWVQISTTAASREQHHHLHTPQVQTSSFTSTSTADLDSSAFWSRLHAAGLLGANTVDAGTAPSLEFPNLVWQTWYRCDYCGIAKASTSGVKNGRTRIRCQCGGTRQDGVLRLHQQWSVTFEDTSKIRRPTECYTQRPQFCIDTHDVQSSRSHHMKRKPAQPWQAHPSQSATQSNVKCVSQRVPHPTTEKSVPRLPPPPEPRHLLEPAAS